MVGVAREASSRGQAGSSPPRNSDCGAIRGQATRIESVDDIHCNNYESEACSRPALAMSAQGRPGRDPADRIAKGATPLPPRR